MAYTPSHSEWSTQQVTPYNKARKRFDSRVTLWPHEDTIFADWPEGDDHWNWIATAPCKDIIEWATDIEDANAYSLIAGPVHA
jgi:hypothetical protein